jgi:hypothetical protein
VPFSETTAIVSPAPASWRRRSTRSAPRRARRRGRAEQHEIGAEVAAHARERFAAERVRLGQGEVDAHPRDVLARDRPQLLAGGELGGEHLGQRRRDPRGVGPPRQVLETEDGDRPAGARPPRRRCAPRARRAHPHDEESGDRGERTSRGGERERHACGVPGTAATVSPCSAATTSAVDA